MDIREDRKEYLQYCREMDLDPEISLYWVIYLAGRQAGEESMRERAAKVCVDTGGMTAEDCADAIRALPIGGE